jgi:hypothetical protein
MAGFGGEDVCTGRPLAAMTAGLPDRLHRLRRLDEGVLRGIWFVEVKSGAKSLSPPTTSAEDGRRRRGAIQNAASEGGCRARVGSLGRQMTLLVLAARDDDACRLGVLARVVQRS